MYSWQSEVSSEMNIFNFGYLSSGSEHDIHVTKDVPIRGYFSKLKEVQEQKNLGNTGLMDSKRDSS
jgi:hypothetical protein